MRVLATCAGFGVLAACSSAPAPVAAPVQPTASQGLATDYSVASRADRDRFAGLLPQGVAASAIRIGNDNCFYYVAGPVFAPLVAPATPTTQICQ